MIRYGTRPRCLDVDILHVQFYMSPQCEQKIMCNTININVQGAAKKVAPKVFLPFSQQPLRILTRNFTDSFTETFYI